METKFKTVALYAAASLTQVPISAPKFPVFSIWKLSATYAIKPASARLAKVHADCWKISPLIDRKRVLFQRALVKHTPNHLKEGNNTAEVRLLNKSTRRLK